jgi:hypothetical protein
VTRRLVAAAVVAAVLAAGCGAKSATGVGVGFGPFPSTPPVPSGVEVGTWAAKFCSVNLTDSRLTVERKMGDPPTATFAVADEWYAYEWSFNAFFHADGTLQQLDINDIQLTAGEKAALPCATTRFAQ